MANFLPKQPPSFDQDPNQDEIKSPLPGEPFLKQPSQEKPVISEPTIKEPPQKRFFQKKLPPDEPSQPDTAFPISGSSKPNKILFILSSILILVSIPVAVYLVKQRQEIRKKATCDPDPCVSIPSQRSQGACETWCKEQEKYEDVCHSKTVLDENCNEVICWYCQLKPEYRPTPTPGGCQDPTVDKQTQEGCERACSCDGWDIDNCFEDTCQQSSDQCWYCKKRSSCLNDCCQAGCQSLTAYNQNWQLITSLTALSPGTKIRFLVQGYTQRTSITNARFRINGGAWQNPTGQHNNNFYFEYTFTNPGNYKIEAMVYSPDVGWR